MIRLTAALTAVALLASVPANAESLRVSLVGKSSDQIRADIVAAAKTVCAQEMRSDALGAKLQCVRATTRDALNQIPSSQAANLDSSELAQR